MLATYLIRHADIPGAGTHSAEGSGSHGVGRLGGGVGKALEQWVVETWLYIVLMSAVYGVVVGYGSCKALKFALRKCVSSSRLYSNARTRLYWMTGSGSTTRATCCFPPPLA